MRFPDICPEGSIAVLTDTHPNEWTSQKEYDVYEMLETRRPEGVWAQRVNEKTLLHNRATGRNDRATDINIQVIDDEYAAQHPDAYEVRRKPEIEQAVRAARLVLYLHGSNGGLESYAYYNPNATDEIRGIASRMRLSRAVMYGASNLGYGQPHHMILDNARCDMGTYLEDIYDLVQRLGAGETFKPEPIQEYQWVADVRAADARRVGLADFYPPWQPIPAEDHPKLQALELPVDGVTASWDYEAYAESTGYIGEWYMPLDAQRNNLL